MQRINIPRVIRTVSPTRVARFTHRQLHSTRALGAARGQEVWSSPVVLAELEVADEQLVVDLGPQVAGPEEMHTVQVGDVHTPAEGGREGEREREREREGFSGTSGCMNILHMLY